MPPLFVVTHVKNKEKEAIQACDHKCEPFLRAYVFDERRAQL